MPGRDVLGERGNQHVVREQGGGVGAAAGIALINSIGNTGGFVGPYLVGYIRDATHSFAWGLVMIGAVLAFVPMLVLMVDEPSRRP